MTFTLALALAALLVNIVVGIDLIRGNRMIRSLQAVEPVLPAHIPRVSVIVPARNEERNIGAALAAMQQLDYPDLELILVNDRSDDATASIMDAIAKDDPRMQVVHVTELPAGWLGKNNALWLGAARASGELLLFTDADIVMAPSLIRRAVAYLVSEKVDHLVVTPRMEMPGRLLPMFGLTFMLVFAMFTRPWKARDPKSRAHIGIGAFNLVRAESYRACGGHEAIRLRPDDDLKLGKLIKKNGFAQDIVAGPDFMSVEWYSTVGEVVRGLEKNTFAGVDYRLWMAAGGVIVLFLLLLWPFLALLFTVGATRYLNLLIVAIIVLLLINCADANKLSRWYVIGFPLALALFIWILIRTTTLNLVQGGITWRGTFYRLAELKGNRI
ncbi:MAG: glycosyl transferase [Desulfuromonas sp.]|nr:MAG: glycosyl transferase [Desulfuromonas sp.]